MEEQPQPRPQTVCVVGQNFCAAYPTELSVQRKAISFSGGDFTVTDTNGNLVLKVAGKAMSLHDRRVLQDAAGNPLLTMQEKTFTMHSRWEVFTGESSDDKDIVFSVKKSSVFHLKTTLEVFMAGDKEEKVCDFHVKGSYLDRCCTICQGDHVLAEMKRKYTVGNVLLGKDTFTVLVNPGIDYAFIVALIIILDEINQEDSEDD